MIRGQPPRISPLAASICPFIGMDRSRRKAGGAFVSAWKGLSSGQIPLHARPAPDSTCKHHRSAIPPFPDFLLVRFSTDFFRPTAPCSLARFYRLPIIACDLYNGQPPLTMVRSCLFAVYSDRGFDGLARVSVNGTWIKGSWFVFGIFQIARMECQ